MDIPKKATQLVDLAGDYGWQLSVDETPQTVEVEYDDGTVRYQACDTYLITGDKGDAIFGVGWLRNPFTDRWNVRMKQIGLVIADDMGRRLAEAMGQMPEYRYFEDPNFGWVEVFITEDDPEAKMREWLGE